MVQSRNQLKTRTKHIPVIRLPSSKDTRARQRRVVGFDPGSRGVSSKRASKVTVYGRATVGQGDGAVTQTLPGVLSSAEVMHRLSGCCFDDEILHKSTCPPFCVSEGRIRAKGTEYGPTSRLLGTSNCLCPGSRATNMEGSSEDGSHINQSRNCPCPV